MIILDTSVLVSAFRRRDPDSTPAEVSELRRLIESDAPLAVPGIVLQEVLAGARTKRHFGRLARLTRGFPVVLADRRLHRRAAALAGECRWAGLTTTATDCLIAMHAVALPGALFTLDTDFERIAQHCNLKLHAW